jgi:hypothetical protein
MKRTAVLFDNLVGAHQKRFRDGEAECFRAADEVLDHREFEDRESDRHGDSNIAALARRRGDRISAPGQAGAIQPVQVRRAHFPTVLVTRGRFRLSSPVCRRPA